MKRKEYVSEVCSKHFEVVRDNVYGFSDYDKNLCKYMLSIIPKESILLEVGIGTGYPFAQYFQSQEFTIHGIDISPYLVNICIQRYPGIVCKVGDAEELSYADSTFDLVYCFHSTWYFPNLIKAIDEMIRTAKQGGFIIFDIQNRNHEQIADNYRQRKKDSMWSSAKGVKKILKNLIKIVLRRKDIDWFFGVYETPTYPSDIYQHLNKNNNLKYKILVSKDIKTISEHEPDIYYKDFPRLIFMIEKTSSVKNNQ